jgi:hypothetical protein
MSLPFFRLHCTDCDYCTYFYYDTEYRFLDAHAIGFEPSLEMCWCHSCENLAIVATPVTEQHIASEVRRLQALCEKERAPIFGFLPKHKISAKEQLFQQQIDRLHLSVEFFKQREMESVCLQCGGKEVEEFDIDILNSDNPVDIGVYHWECGGRILVNKEGRISFADGSMPVVQYDVDGRITSEGRNNVSQVYLATTTSHDMQGFIDYQISEHSRNALNRLASNGAVAILDCLGLSAEQETALSSEVTALALFLTVKSFVAQTEFPANSSILTTQILASEPWIQHMADAEARKVRHSLHALVRPYADVVREHIQHPEQLPHELQDFGHAAATILAASVSERTGKMLSESQIGSLAQGIANAAGALHFSVQGLHERNLML